MKPNFYRKVLPNGMTIIFEKRETGVVSVAFAVRCGGANESFEDKGISHFIEHLLYKGTPTRTSKMIAEEIEKKGGDLNGFTNEEATAYWCKMPSKHLNVALDVLSDMIKNPLFKEEEIQKERHVIFEEMKMYKDNPVHYVFEKMQGALYDGPLGVPLIGTEKTLGSFTREEIVKRFQDLYHPKNMILCVVGDADFKNIVDFAKRNFPEKTAGKRKSPSYKIIFKNKTGQEERKGIDQASLVFAYHVPPFGKKGSHAADVLSTLMAGGMSSRLFQEIREKRNLAYSVHGGTETALDFSHNYIYVGTKKENVEKVLNLVVEEFNKVSRDLSEEELRQVKEEILGNYQISGENSPSRMVYLLNYEIWGDAKKFYDFEKMIKEVKLSDVKKLAAAAAEKHSFFSLVPEETPNGFSLR